MHESTHSPGHRSESYAAIPLCEPSEVALKSFFLGPQAENAVWLSRTMQELLRLWFAWRRESYPEDGAAISMQDKSLPSFVCHQDKVRSLALGLMQRYAAEVPKFSPRYMGHMFSEISLPAVLGHVISLLHNPNLIASEAAPVGVQIEQEAIEELLAMVGFTREEGMGHFTSGGTLANDEALVRARERSALWMARGLAYGMKGFAQAAHMGWEAYQTIGLQAMEADLHCSRISPWALGSRLRALFQRDYAGPVLIVPRSKHYSWVKAAHLIGLGEESLWQIPLDASGKISLSALKEALDRAEAEDRPVLMVVSVAGTTEMGEVDPVHRVQDLLDRRQKERGFHIWHHVDAAYGGFLRTLGGPSEDGLSPEVWSALEALSRVQSITLDPHKLGYVPYASGTFLTQKRQDYFVTAHDAPYIQYRSVLDRGRYTLEGSRPAGGATATWLTARSIGLHEQGYGWILQRTVRMRRDLEAKLMASGLPIQLAPGADTNILCFHMAKPGDLLSHSNAKTQALFEAFRSFEKPPFFVSKTILHKDDYDLYLESFAERWQARVDAPEMVLIRLCLMNPFFASREMKVDFFAEFVTFLKAHLRADLV